MPSDIMSSYFGDYIVVAASFHHKPDASISDIFNSTLHQILFDGELVDHSAT